jgi:hypothetical protein
VQRGGFSSEEDARAALERVLERLRRESGVARRPTLADFVDEFLENHIYRDDAVGLFSKRTHRLERCPASKPMSELRSRPS